MTDVVPCGKCPTCLNRRASGWAFRLEQEQRRSTTAAFLTLTYNDENLPMSPNGLPTLVKKHHQKFMKRLRKTIKTHFPNEKDKKIRYYMCGEYGETYGRPHYHSIIFNLPNDYINHPQLITKEWQLGETMLAECNPATIRYVCGYINKTLYTNQQPYIFDPATGEILKENDIQKEFSMMSKGLGHNYITNARIRYYKQKLTPYLTVENGDKYTMPRYYKEKFYTEAQKSKINEKTKLHLAQNPVFLSEKERVDYTENAFRQKDKNNKIKRQTM